MFNKLIDGIRLLTEASPNLLRQRNFIEQCIRQVGLQYDTEELYDDESEFMNLGSGIWQLPAQFSALLIFLTDFRINTILEVGTGSGWTIAFMTAYLRQFNQDIRVLSIDPLIDITQGDYSRLEEFLPIRFERARSDDLRDQRFDLCFIDGDHSYSWCKRDYENVGSLAPICVFHDTHNRFVLQRDEWGGVPRYWGELKIYEYDMADFHEFLDHPRKKAAMGIGVRVKRDNTSN